jgi:hypothetical protein
MKSRIPRFSRHGRRTTKERKGLWSSLSSSTRACMVAIQMTHWVISIELKRMSAVSTVIDPTLALLFLTLQLATEMQESGDRRSIKQENQHFSNTICRQRTTRQRCSQQLVTPERAVHGPTGRQYGRPSRSTKSTQRSSLLYLCLRHDRREANAVMS